MSIHKVSIFLKVITVAPLEPPCMVPLAPELTLNLHLSCVKSLTLIIVFIFLGIFYYLIISFLSKKGSNLSFKVLNSNQKLSQLANEIIKGIREIQIFGIQNLLMEQVTQLPESFVAIKILFRA